MTLLGHKTWKTPDSAIEALELLRKDSVTAIGNGGNINYGIGVIYRNMVMPDAVIHMNGTWAVVEGNILFEHLMNRERLRVLLGYGDIHGTPLGVNQEGKGYYIRPEGVVRMD